ncbi:MAG: HNH endonuclease [Desulfamplus sp.]|nr:HNH endonuclease [Desulfamplus sp.]
MEFYFSQDEDIQKQERHKARELRNSQWWKRKRSQGVCHYCQRIYPPKELTMDHIVPISRGGRSVKNNVVPCCKTCNTKKLQMLPIEWHEYMNSLGMD